MRTVTFKSVFEGILRRHGMDPRGDAVASDTGLAVCEHVNARVKRAWFAWEWPEWTITEERAFRQIWNNSRQFYQVGGGPAAAGDEVFYIPNVATHSLVDAAYYRVKAGGSGNPPIGTPPTNTTYWEKMDSYDTYIAFDQVCRRRIGEVLDVCAANPAVCKPPRTLTHRPTENGIQIYEAGGLLTVFVRYLIPAERFTIFPYIASRTYLRGDVAYVAEKSEVGGGRSEVGECYQAIQVATGKDPVTETSYWRRCLFPEVLAHYVRAGAFADSLRDSDTSDERDPVMLQIRGQQSAAADSEAEDELNRQINRLQAQGQHYFYLPFGVMVGRGGGRIGGIASVPGYVLQGAADSNYGPIAPTGTGVTTISDRCETEWGYIPPPPPPSPEVPGLDVVSGITPLVSGQGYIDVVFPAPEPNADWIFVECGVVNTVDSDPLNISPGIITSKTPSGFRLQLNGTPDSGNYSLHWAISEASGGVPPTAAATTYILAAPTSGGISVPSSAFTVELPEATSVSAPVTVTPSDGGAGGTFTPASVILTTATPAAAFTYTPASYGAKTISVTNDGGLTDPGSRTFTCVATTYLLSGPSGGVAGAASTNFSVALPAGAVVAGTVTVMPSSGSGGGTFTPTTVSLTTGAPSATFTYTPTSAGAKTISVTNNKGLANPASLTYTATPPLVQHLLNTLISYWKLDEASGTRNDSQGTNHLAAINAPVGVAGKINNGVQLVAANSQSLDIASNSSLQVTGSFTFSVWVKLTSQGGGDDVVFSKDLVAAGNRDYWLNYATGGGGFYFAVNAAAAYASVGSNTADGVWTHIVCWYDSTTSKCSIRLNDTTTIVGTNTSALVQGTGDFQIGKRFGGALPGYLNGIVDEVGFWKRLLTSDEITLLDGGLPFSSFLP